MTRDEIIGIAREAGGGLSCIAEPLEHPWKFSESELIRFAALVASSAKAEENEACAKVCEAEEERKEDDGTWLWEARRCAKSIRARN